MTSLQMRRLLLPSKFHIRTCLLRSSTIASTTDLDDAHTIKPFSDVSRPSKPFNEMPGPTGVYDIPYLGMAFHFQPFTKYGQLDEVTESLRDKYGDIFKIRMDKERSVFISHPDYVEQVFRLPYKENRRYVVPIQDIFYKRNDITARGLSILNGEEWSKLRKPVQDRLLKPGTKGNYIPLIDGVTNDFIQKIGKNQTIEDLLKELAKYTAESVGMVTLNKRLGNINDQSEIDFASVLANILSIFQESFFMPIHTYKYFRTKMYMEFERDLLLIYDLVLDIMKEQTENLQKLDKDGKLEEYLEKEPNFLHMMLSDTRMTPQQVGSVIIDMFTGAIYSTANGLLFALCDLALHPDKQTILFEEINRVVGDSPHIKTEHLQNMSFMRACLKESQRLIYPVAPGGLRFMESDVNVGGYTIPKGTKVFLNNELMCKDERFFPKVKEYLPERWIRDNTTELSRKSRENPFIVKPFGFGARICPGQRIAEMQMMIGVAKVIQHFEVSLPSEVKDIKWHRNIFATPIDKVNLCLQRRQTIQPST